MKSITTTNAPAAAGHYSQGIVHNGVVYVSGQLPIVPGSIDHTVGTIEEQAEQVLKTVDAILIAGGSSLQHVLQLTIYITDMALWGRLNVVSAKFYGNHNPTRPIIPLHAPHYGYQIDVVAIGAVKDA